MEKLFTGLSGKETFNTGSSSHPPVFVLPAGLLKSVFWLSSGQNYLITAGLLRGLGCDAKVHIAPENRQRAFFPYKKRAQGTMQHNMSLAEKNKTKHKTTSKLIWAHLSLWIQMSPGERKMPAMN